MTSKTKPPADTAGQKKGSAQHRLENMGQPENEEDEREMKRKPFTAGPDKEAAPADKKTD